MSAPALSHEEKVKHLYSRACFGLSAEQAFAGKSAPIREHVLSLMAQGADPQPLDAVHEHLLPRLPYREMTEEEARAFGRARQRLEESVNLGWMERLCTTQAPFVEMMTFFWHCHFACRNGNAWFLQQLNDVQRRHALGNFRDLVLAVSQTPAMLSFLNNQQNRKGRPNENFARELMELFTLGIGNYKEDDVKAAARAFTGWRYSGQTLEFQFDPKQHDNSEKVFRGRRGRFNGEDIIDIILRDRQCANFLAAKIYAFFVNERPDKDHIEQLAHVIYSADYAIAPAMEFLFTSDWFYAPQNVGNRIKSPVELIVGLSRQFNIHYEDPRVLLRFQRSLGQALFYPPNVAGWPGGQKWIDSSSLMARMKFASTVLNGGLIEFEGKTDPEDEAFVALQRREQRQVRRRVQTHPNWEQLEALSSAKDSPAQLTNWLIAPPVPAAFIARINASDFKAQAIQIASTPEYQLC